MNTSLPDAMKIAHLQALVTEGIESGESERSMDELKNAAAEMLIASSTCNQHQSGSEEQPRFNTKPL